MSNAAKKSTPPPELAADRRKQILKAAVEVFAERGFHRTRVSDIAKRAGVAYGLIYHYFDSKDDVLNSLFEENWSVFLKVLHDLENNHELSAAEKLSSIAALLIDALQIAPSTIQVIIQEVSRSDRFVHAEKAGAFRKAFEAVQGIIADGQKRGEIRTGLSPQIGAYIFFGALETICTGFMLKHLKLTTTEDAAAVKHTVSEIILNGLVEKGARR
jgi:TetR/AcrR family transcriptional regulator, fatty acid metabolism regulator protein